MAVIHDLTWRPDEGCIVGTEHRLAYGRTSMTWEWEGPDVATIDLRLLQHHFGISPHSIAVGKRLTIGPFPVRVIEEEWGDQIRVMRGNKVHTLLRALIHRNTRWLDRIYRRLVMTGYVWGFATVHEGTIPYWRDVHILRRIAERLGK